MTFTDYAQIAVGGGTAGLSFGALFVAVRWCANFIFGRLDKKEAHIDAGTQRLFERLEKRLDAEITRGDRHELELRECQDRHSECEARVKQLEATFQGYGDAREKAALIVAAEKRKGRE